MNGTAYVILGFLAAAPRSGYEIKSLVDVSTRFFWAASYGQIYPELKRLEDEGLVRGRDDDAGARRRRRHEITPAGRESLHAWLTAGGPLHFELRHEGFLRFFFCDELGGEDRRELLRTIRASHEGAREQLEAIRPHAQEQGDEGRSFPLHTLEFGIAYQEFIIDWAERMERRLAGGGH